MGRGRVGVRGSGRRRGGVLCRADDVRFRGGGGGSEQGHGLRVHRVQARAGGGAAGGVLGLGCPKTAFFNIVMLPSLQTPIGFYRGKKINIL